VVSQTDTIGRRCAAFVEPEIAAGRIVALPYQAPWMCTPIMAWSTCAIAPVSRPQTPSALPPSSAEKAYFDGIAPSGGEIISADDPATFVNEHRGPRWWKAEVR